MSNIKSIISKLPNMEFLQPASENQIRSAEEQLGLRFADEYREYLSFFWNGVV